VAASLKAAYLIHGDDHGAVAERRAGLRALAERAEGGAASVELLDGEDATPAGVAQALATMTLAVGRRVIIVEGVERWREADVEQHLCPAMGEMPPETTLALFAREEGRAKAPAALHDAVKRAGGQVVAQMTVKPWELPKWAREQATRMGLSLDAAAAKALVAQVGERQQRLLRELEKLVLEDERSGQDDSSPPGTPSRGAGATGSGSARAVTVEEIELRAAHSAEWRAYGLADALVGGDRREATLTYLRLRHQGERLSGLSYLMAQRLRDALALALRLRAGESAAEVRRGLRMPPRAADRLISDVSRTEPDRLRQALVALAALEVDTRGGALIASGRGALAGMGEDTLALRALEAMTGGEPGDQPAAVSR
jgi:DNA polymerase-3 subunit delta